MFAKVRERIVATAVPTTVMISIDAIPHGDIVSWCMWTNKWPRRRCCLMDLVRRNESLSMWHFGWAKKKMTKKWWTQKLDANGHVITRERAVLSTIFDKCAGSLFAVDARALVSLQELRELSKSSRPMTFDRFSLLV